MQKLAEGYGVKHYPLVVERACFAVRRLDLHCSLQSNSIICIASGNGCSIYLIRILSFEIVASKFCMCYTHQGLTLIRTRYLHGHGAVGIECFWKGSITKSLYCTVNLIGGEGCEVLACSPALRHVTKMSWYFIYLTYNPVRMVFSMVF